MSFGSIEEYVIQEYRRYDSMLQEKVIMTSHRVSIVKFNLFLLMIYLYYRLHLVHRPLAMIRGPCLSFGNLKSIWKFSSFWLWFSIPFLVPHITLPSVIFLDWSNEPSAQRDIPILIILIRINSKFKQSCSLSNVKIQPDEKSSNISNVGTKNRVPVLGVLKSNNLP